MMTQPPSPWNVFAKGLVGAILLIQVFDIVIHVATNQIEPLRITSNLIIFAWIALIMSGKFIDNLFQTTGVFLFAYLACNGLFLVREGVTNPNQGGQLRVVLFVLVGVTVGLSVMLAVFRRQSKQTGG